MYQHAATVGKRMYIDNERELAIITGDEGVDIFTMSKDLRNEDFRVFISRENDDAVLKQQANQMLNIFLEQGLIDDKVFANLFDRATPNDVTMALRSQAGLRIEAAKKAVKEEQSAMAGQKQEQDALMAQDRQDKLNAQNQQERIVDKTIKAKSDDMITKAIINEDMSVE